MNRDRLTGPGRRRRYRRVAAVLCWTAALLLLGGLVGEMLLIPTPRLAVPSGPYAVGTRVYDWVDASRPEPFTPDRSDRRELVAQVWYPADHVPDARPVSYLQHQQVDAAWAGQFGVPPFLLRRVHQAPTHSYLDIPPAPGRFPVLVNLTGYGGARDASLFWIEDIVSHGYVVVGIDQPGTAAATVFSDGRVVSIGDRSTFSALMPLALQHAGPATPRLNGVDLPGGIVPFLALDATFALTQLHALDQDDELLAGHLDTVHAGIYGMSLGAYTTAEACRTDLRFKACLAVDAGQTAEIEAHGITQPVMVMSRDPDVMRAERAQAGGWSEAEIKHTIDGQRALFRLSSGPAFYLTMNEMYHLNWTDVPLFSPIIRWHGLAGPTDPYQGFAATDAWTLAFFDRYLKGKPAPLLDGTSPDWPQVRVERR